MGLVYTASPLLYLLGYTVGAENFIINAEKLREGAVYAGNDPGAGCTEDVYAIQAPDGDRKDPQQQKGRVGRLVVYGI